MKKVHLWCTHCVIDVHWGESRHDRRAELISDMHLFGCQQGRHCPGGYQFLSCDAMEAQRTIDTALFTGTKVKPLQITDFSICLRQF